jgi:glycosyltransferase involved in cell wall biosynthesis
VKLLIINHNAGRPDLGYAFRPYYLAQEWIKLGHTVTIIGATFSHVRRGITKAGEEDYKGIRYIWIKNKSYKGNGIGRLISMVQFVSRIWIRASRLSQKLQPDIVIASSTYPLDIYPARKIAIYSKAQLCFELHDLWPLSPIELGGYSRNHPFIKVMQHAEDYYCKYADKVISIIPYAKEYLIRRGMNESKFFYVPNGIATEEWSTAISLDSELINEITHIKEEFDFVVAYAGAHGLANDLSTLVNAAELVTNEKIGFILIGDGPEKENLKNLALKKGLKNILFLNSVAKKFIPGILDNFDALYIGLKKESLFRFGISPNKIFDYMMAAKPIIQAIDAGNNLVQEANCGIYAEASNEQAIAQAILQLKSMTKEQRLHLGQNGKAFVMRHHTYKVLAMEFLNAFSK